MYLSQLDISFELPSEEELQSSGGIEFSTDQSQIYIPYTAIQHQKKIEGRAVCIYVQPYAFLLLGFQVPVVNYAAKNLANILPARAFINK